MVANRLPVASQFKRTVMQTVMGFFVVSLDNVLKNNEVTGLYWLKLLSQNSYTTYDIYIWGKLYIYVC